MSVVRDSDYKFIDSSSLPEEIYDELCNDCPSNDCGVIINPEYRPKFKAWLEEQKENSEDCYIVWFSW